MKEEHQEIYQKLDRFLHEISSVKNTRNDEFLISKVEALLVYVEQLLKEHFQIEEDELFPALIKSNPELEASVEVCLEEHKTIKTKFTKLTECLLKFKQDQSIDYKSNLLFPAYNLIATINHHAQREDRELF